MVFFRVSLQRWTTVWRKCIPSLILFLPACVMWYMYTYKIGGRNRVNPRFTNKCWYHLKEGLDKNSWNLNVKKLSHWKMADNLLTDGFIPPVRIFRAKIFQSITVRLCYVDCCKVSIALQKSCSQFCFCRLQSHHSIFVLSCGFVYVKS